MPASYDGDIKLSVSLDPKSVVKSADELTRRISRIFEATEGKQTDAGFKKILASMDKTNTKATALRDKLRELVEQQELIDTAKSGSGDNERLKQLEHTIEVLDQIRKYGSVGNIAETYKLQIPEGMDFEDYSEQVVTEYERMKESLKTLSTVSDEEYNKLSQDIKATKTALSEMNNEMRLSLEKVGDLEGGTRRYEGANEELTRAIQQYVDKAREEGVALGEVETAIAKISARAAELESMPGGFESDEYKRLYEQFQELVPKYYELKDAETEEADQMVRLIQAVRGVIAEEDSLKHKMGELMATFGQLTLNQAISPFKRIADSISNIGKQSMTSNISMKKLLRTILRYGIGVRSLFYLFRKLRAAIAEGFKNLQQFNGGVNPVATTMNELSASLTTLKNAWATAFAPILQFVAPVLQTLINMLVSAANAIAQFFGALTGQTKIIKATKAQQNLGKAIGGTGAAADKAKGQLAAFDELNLLDQDSGSGGGGGGAGDLSGLGFEEVEVESKFKDLAEKIKESWENADFTEIGTIVGTKIKEALDSAYDWLTGPVRDFAWRLSRSIATFLNGVIEVPNLGTSIGKVIGAALNDAFLFANTFMEEFHWDSLGRLLGEALQAGFREFDWGNITKWWSNKFIALFNFLRGVIEGIDWKALPKDIWDALVEYVKGINVHDLVYSLALLIRTAFDAIIEFGISMWEGVLDTIFDIKEYFDKYIEDAKAAGGNWFEGLIQGILDAVTGVGEWIWTNVCEPIVEAFRGFFKIGSPSKVMEDLGIDLMRGLFNGIESLVENIKQIWEDLKNWVEETITALGGKIKEIWENIKTTVTTVVTNIKTSVTNIWTTIKTTVSSTVEGLRNSVTTTWNNLKTTLSNTVENIKTKITGAFNAIKTTASSIFTGMKTAVTNAFSGMWSGIRGTVNSILGGIETMANGVVNGVNRIIRALNSLSFDVPDWIPSWLGGGKSFGVHLNTIGGISLPRLAQGAVIPPNKEFLAVLGDQTSGTNIEAPMDTIKQAFRDVLGESGGVTSAEVVQLLQELISVVAAKKLTISRKEIGDSAIDEINRRTRRTGNTPILG